VPNSRIPIMSLGLEIIFCSNRSYAHSRAVFNALVPSSGDAWTIVGETCIKNRMASFWSRYCYIVSKRLPEGSHFHQCRRLHLHCWGLGLAKELRLPWPSVTVCRLDRVLVSASRVMCGWGNQKQGYGPGLIVFTR
jgi:hypothetical protein